MDTGQADKMDSDLHPERIVLQVEQGAGEGERLDRYLAARLPDWSRSRIQALAKDGRVLVNGRAASPKQPVRAGDQVEIRPAEAVAADLAAEEAELAVLFEDDHVIVVDKPAGLCVHPGAGVATGTLVHALLHHCGGKLSRIGEADRPGIVHRLDKDTSGCLVAAKSDEAHRALTEAFAARETRKEYLCVVAGSVRDDSGRIEDRIGRNPGNRQKMAVVAAPAGKPAVTDWEVLAREAGASLVRCRIHTGRTHQIRVHMAYELGHAILGDVLYGRGTLRTAGAERLLLHAWRLGFAHPVSGEPLLFEAAVPEPFDRFGWIRERKADA
jgi:23S rRNA pseudouridine1911/1915/1917 synthase